MRYDGGADFAISLMHLAGGSALGNHIIFYKIVSKSLYSYVKSDFHRVPARMPETIDWATPYFEASCL